ncbi:3D domain-containing protein [Marinobacterium sedimentorum]|uniref:3D domain-containing protein n=1 Tax=Marinobacterium sedimentorum TaxID=2927804 RepID=UPI0020C5F4BE|nr:3D domain-containing protein [Marinobacterium sedimentorum]MCP8690379.1 3D domain-containing protein [Marinobacterium sedimentorum]
MMLNKFPKRLVRSLVTVLLAMPLVFMSGADAGWASEKLSGDAAIQAKAHAKSSGKIRPLALDSLQGGGAASSKVKLKVTATAYNSLPDQTQGKANIGAWGHRLKPGLKAIAVSRDLLGMGLEPGTEVEIEGLPGRYQVLDKMHRRWARKIDIYMGLDEDAALAWGKRPVVIRWENQDS